MKAFTSLRVALVHDWLTGVRGGEVVLSAIAELFPKADLFTLLFVPGTLTPELSLLKRHTSWLQRVPQIEKRYRYFLPFFPQAIESLDLTGFDLIISSSHCVAKGIRKPPGSVHVSYIHAPMRYMWDRFEDYFGKDRASWGLRLAAQKARPFLQRWDQRVSTPERIDHCIANSHFIAGQVRQLYGRPETTVIHPFVEASRFRQPRQRGSFYLMVSALVPYKRVDLAIEAFRSLNHPLYIVGTGPEAKRLKRQAPPHVEFFGSLSRGALADFYSKCRALIFPGIEDFGITPLEAMAAGAPVIAYGEGGVLETVTAETGLFFTPQTAEALRLAVLEYEQAVSQFSEEACRKRASQFTRERFQEQLLNTLAVQLERHLRRS